MKVAVTPFHRLRLAALGSALLAVACEGKVDLSNPENPYLALPTEQVIQLTVDDQRVYWASFTHRGPGAFIRSCPKQDFERSQITYTSVEAGSPTSFGVQNGQVFWFRPAGSSWELVACDVAGCRGEPKIIAQLPGTNELGLREAVFDDGFAYYFGEIENLAGGRTSCPIFRVSLSGQDASASVIATTASVTSLAVHDDYLYWLGFDPSSDGTSTNPGSVQRVLKDGSAAPERLVNNLELIDATPAERSAHLGLAVDDAYFYWARNALLGSIFRCPLAGCSSAPEQVASPIRFPLGLLPDGPNLYWAYRSDVSSYSIAKCQPASCRPALGVIQHSTSANVLTLDDEYLYTATTETPYDIYDQWTSITSTIRRFPK